MAAARHVGVARRSPPPRWLSSRGSSAGWSCWAAPGGVAVYDDFAHHPTAIATTLQGLRARAGNGRVIALIEPRSNTMRMGEHRGQLTAATAVADRIYWFQPAGMNWSLESVVAGQSGTCDGGG